MKKTNKRIDLIGMDYAKLPDKERTLRCEEEINVTLKKYNCRIDPTIVITGSGNVTGMLGILPLSPIVKPNNGKHGG